LTFSLWQNQSAGRARALQKAAVAIVRTGSSPSDTAAAPFFGQVIKAAKWVFVIKRIHKVFPQFRPELALHTPHRGTPHEVFFASSSFAV